MRVDVYVCVSLDVCEWHERGRVHERGCMLVCGHVHLFEVGRAAAPLVKQRFATFGQFS